MLVAGLVLLLVGIALAVVSREESYFEEEVEQTWSLNQTLTPPPDSDNSTWWFQFMTSGWYFQFDISSSADVTVMLSYISQNPQTKTTLLEKTGTRFTNKFVTGTSSYWIDIMNKGTSPVSITGKVDAVSRTETTRTVFPYTQVGVVVALIGAATAFYGDIAKPRRPKHT